MTGCYAYLPNYKSSEQTTTPWNFMFASDTFCIAVVSAVAGRTQLAAAVNSGTLRSNHICHHWHPCWAVRPSSTSHTWPWTCSSGTTAEQLFCPPAAAAAGCGATACEASYSYWSPLIASNFQAAQQIGFNHKGSCAWLQSEY